MSIGFTHYGGIHETCILAPTVGTFRMVGKGKTDKNFRQGYSYHGPTIIINI